MQQGLLAPPVVRRVKGAPPVKQLPTPVKTHSPRYFFFPGIGTEVYDVKVPREYAISPAEQFKIPLQVNIISITAEKTYKLRMF